jgi:hypothetical protein
VSHRILHSTEHLLMKRLGRQTLYPPMVRYGQVQGHLAPLVFLARQKDQREE